MPGPSFRKPISIPVNESNFDLPASIYDLALQEDLNGKIFMDCLEEVNTSLDVFYMHHGDVTICSNEPDQVYELAPQGTGDDHGERVIATSAR